MAALQQLFEAYEDLSARHEMYKIKTIGDSFMSTAGLLVPVANPVLSAVRCGLEMVQAAKNLSALIRICWLWMLLMAPLCTR